MNALFIKTFGCQMNEYDSQKMVDLLQDTHQLDLTDDEKTADMFLLNTCSIRQNAQEKLFHQLGRWRKHKEKKPNTVIAVGGCVASQEGEAILKRAPYVDIIFGPQTLHRLPNLLSDVLKNRQDNAKAVAIDVSFPEIEKFDHLAQPQSNGVSAFVSIMEGCSKYCSFCVVPYTRGEEVSRPLSDVVSEIQTLVNQGVKEVNLLGQNVNAYQGKIEEGVYADLAFLIEIVAQIPEIYRIRYTTSHPVEFSDSLISAYANTPKLVSHLHLPIQSGSDRILAMMKRGHTALEYKSKIKQLRKIRPNISLSSDFIIGFPNETQQDFEQTMALIDEIGFDKSFSFIYSQRPGTPAADMIDTVDEQTKKMRLATLQAKINQNTNMISQAMLGTKQIVLVEGQSSYGQTLSGRTENNRVVHFEGTMDLVGQLVCVNITQINANSLLGSIQPLG